MAGVVVVNQHGVYLVDAAGNVMTADSGTTIADHEGVIVAGSDGTALRFLRVAIDGTLRIDPTGTTTQPVSDAGGSLTIDNANLDAALSTLATETKLEAVRALLATIDADTSNLDVALSTRATETTLASIRDTDGIKKITDPLPAGTNNIGDVDVVSSALPTGAATEATLATRASETTLSAINTKTPAQGQTTMANSSPVVVASDQSAIASKNAASSQVDGHSVSIGATTDADSANTLIGRTKQVVTKLAAGLPAALTAGGNLKVSVAEAIAAGTNEIGKVAQGTKAIASAAWPFYLTSPTGSNVTITNDAGVQRVEISGKVQTVGAIAPPATTPVIIYAATPLTVGTHDTSYIIPNGQTFFLQEVVAGNEDPTKGAVTEVFYNNGTVRIVARVYTSGTTVSIGYPDTSEARDGTAMVGNGTTFTIIVRRTKYSGSDIAIDSQVAGYVV